MEHFDPLMVMVDVSQIIEALQHKMTGIVEQTSPRVLIHFFQEHFITDAVVEVFPWMDLVAEVYSVFVELIKDRPPSFCELREPGLH
jgi:hypothetical protein